MCVYVWGGRLEACKVKGLACFLNNLGQTGLEDAQLF